MTRCVEVLCANPVEPVKPARTEVVFKGRTRHDTKRALLKYWSKNQSSLQMELDEFQRRCAWTSDGRIIFHSRPTG